MLEKPSHMNPISRDEVQMILNTTLDGVIIQNSSRQVEFANSAAMTMFGDEVERICRGLIEEADRMNEAEQRDRVCFERDGKHFHASVTRLSDRDGTIRIVSVVSDITSIKRLQQQLEQSQKLKALGQMALGIAHDFNNVLSAILGRAQLLRRDLLNQQALESGLEIIEKASLDATEMIRRTQQFARSAKDTDLAPVDINEIANDVVEITRPRWQDQAQNSGINITVSVHPGKVPRIMGNASDLREVLTNLVFNSIEAMPCGGAINIKTGINRDGVSISISDTGTGMPEQVKRKVFEPFFTTKGTHNSGLGLSIARGIIDKHNGNIGIDSGEGCGTTVTINLPIAKALEKMEQPTHAPVKAASANILVIDDEPMIRDLFREILARDGHEITLSASSREGLRVFGKGRYDIVYTDLGMPEVSGWEVASAIKKRDPSIVVVMVTGWGTQIDSKKSEESGVDFVISKPFQVHQLRDSVAQAMEIREKIRSESPVYSGGSNAGFQS